MVSAREASVYKKMVFSTPLEKTKPHFCELGEAPNSLRLRSTLQRVFPFKGIASAPS